MSSKPPVTPLPSPPALPRTTIAEVRFSLSEMLMELKNERTTSAFAMEKLDQHEIGKLFKAKGARRAKSVK